MPGQVPASTGHGQPHSRLAWWAVGLSVVFVVAITAAFTMMVIGYAVGGWDAIEDTTLAYATGAVAGVGAVAALGAFGLAIVVKVHDERWTLLWLPLCAFPAFLAFLVLGETFWWE
jgi:hypothetical protein